MLSDTRREFVNLCAWAVDEVLTAPALASLFPLTPQPALGADGSFKPRFFAPNTSWCDVIVWKQQTSLLSSKEVKQRWCERCMWANAIVKMRSFKRHDGIALVPLADHTNHDVAALPHRWAGAHGDELCASHSPDAPPLRRGAEIFSSFLLKFSINITFR